MLLVPVVLLFLIPILLYLPPVQDWAVGFATRKVSESTGMSIHVGKLRLKFPLRLDVTDVSIVEAHGDTMLTAGRALADIKVLPLLKGVVDVNSIGVDDAFYQLGNSDSLMWLRARIDRGDIVATGIALSDRVIDLGHAGISGVNVWMRMLPDTMPVPTDTAAAEPWLVKANGIDMTDVTYSMSMEPLIDSLGCHIDKASLRKAVVDMNTYRITGQSLAIDSVDVAYIYPAVTDSSAVETKAEEETEATSQLWTITADTLRLTGRSALYAEKGAEPLEGFDPAYIQASQISVEIDSFYNRGTDIRVPLRKLNATERCGLPLHADGLFTMDSSMMTASAFTLSTLRSILHVDASMGIGDLTTDESLPITLKGHGAIDPADVAVAFPAMRAMVAPLKLTSVYTDIEGTAAALNVYALNLAMPDVMRLEGEGTIDYPFNPEKTGGGIGLKGQLATLTDKQYSFLPIKVIPALQMQANVEYHPGQAGGDVNIVTRTGRLTAGGSWTASTEEYDADIELDKFPIEVFMPELGLAQLSATASVDGRGYDPMSRSTSVDADVRLKQVEYMRKPYKDISLHASLHAGVATGQLVSHNPGADGTVDFSAQIHSDTVRYSVDGRMADINLLTLGMSDSVCAGHLDLESHGFYNVKTQGLDVTASVSNLWWQLPGMSLEPDAPIVLTSQSEDDGSATVLSNGDMKVSLITPGSLMTFIEGLTPAMNAVQGQIDSMHVNASVISNAMPQFKLTAGMGRNNLAAQYLASSGTGINRTSLSLSNDSLIRFNALAQGITAGTTRIDTIRINAVQNGQYIVYDALMNNRPGTFDDFAHVTLNGFLGSNRMSTFFRQNNIKGENGFTLGFNTSLLDSIVTVKMVPLAPTIAYKPWHVNKDNYISYDMTTKHLDADLQLTGDGSYLKIFTEHDPSMTAHLHGDSLAVDSLMIAERHYHGAQEALKVQLSNIRLQDWLSINPFAPPVKGDVSADMKFMYENATLTGKGNVSLDGLYYGRERVGDFDLAVDVSNSVGGKLMADVALMVDSVRTITARGVLNDSTLATPFLLDFNMINFPLRVVNPFIPEHMATLQGMLNGSMTITGDMANPRFDGYINFDTTAIKVAMLGTTFTLPNEKIPVDSNIVTFKDFNILGCNKNPLSINGTVDATHISDIVLDLDAAAHNIQVVNSNRARGGAQLYGKAFLDLFAGVKGSMQRLRVNADVSLLAGTNVTYVMTDAETTIQGQADQDMVHFVQFSDTAQVQRSDSIATTTMAMWLDADLHLMEGSTINVDLSPNGSNRAQIQPSGDLAYTLSPLNGQRLTGRLNINKGFVRYTPPLLSEKNFQFQEGSYVAFNGDMMNPVLNINAVDYIRANVTQEGQNSRLVNFDVMLAITGTLQSLNVSFDLSTGDDITVQNELSSMSAEQRANKAMNLLLYNVYSGAGTKANALSAGNPLFSFLTSQINSWAANNIRGVDISFGIDQYDRTYQGATSTATTYSYRVSKSLFNDRFKIVVGGNYSPDTSEDNFSQNLFNDISFEYMLNQAGSMYVRVFQHTGFESILEGEITQTGVGFVLRRKLNNLWELFGVRRDSPAKK